MKVLLASLLLSTLGGTIADATRVAGVDGDQDRVLGAQAALSRVGFSVGVIDGKWGKNTSEAVRSFQRSQGLDATGELDESTVAALDEVEGSDLIEVEIAAESLAGPFIDERPDDLWEQSKLEHLGYETPLEAIAEANHITPELLQELNPGVTLQAGATLRVPNVGPYSEGEPSSERLVKVSESRSFLELFEGDAVVFAAPVTSGSEHDPLPIGRWTVRGVGWDPTFRYDPSLFHDAPEDHQEAEIAAGPNNPVGVVWIDLDKDHYGIHGTAEPAKIGYATSHGCVRLTNWDARYLASRLAPGARVIFED